MSATLTAAAALWRREVVRFLRQRSRVLVAILTPLMFWLLLGVGIGGNFRPQGAPAGVTYLEYFFPGSILLVLLFTGIFSIISLIQDRQGGFLQGVLVAPVPRTSIALGKVGGGTTLAVFEALLFLVVGWLWGVPIDLGRLPLLIGLIGLVGFGMTAMGFAIGWRMESVQGFHGVMNLLLMPMWLLSGAFFPMPADGGFLAWVMALNPLAYGLVLVRIGLGGPGAELPGSPSFSVSLAVSAGFAVAMLAASTWLVSRESQR